MTPVPPLCRLYCNGHAPPLPLRDYLGSDVLEYHPDPNDSRTLTFHGHLTDITAKGVVVTPDKGTPLLIPFSESGRYLLLPPRPDL